MQDKLQTALKVFRARGLSGCAQLFKHKLSASSTDPVASGISICELPQANPLAPNERYGRWLDLIPLPPSQLMYSVGAQSIENFLVVGDAWAQLVSRHCRSRANIFDIGCGCGRTARFLTLNPTIGSYTGFDVIKENIDWCNNFIAPATSGRFRFLHFDLFSQEYNPYGKIAPAQFSFPVPQNSQELIFAASLFTHLKEADARHYLSEIRRALSSSGTVLISIHTNATQSEPYRGSETRIDILPEYFESMVRDAGLAPKGRLGELCGQDLYLLGAE